MAQPSPIRGVVAYLKSIPDVTSLAGSRIFAEELPTEENKHMPRATIVVSSGGGGLMGHGNEFGDRRFDIICYGETPMKSRTLFEEVRAAMKDLLRQKVSDSPTTFVLLHWARLSADGTTARDVGTDWPVTGSSWQVLASDIPA